MPVLIILVLLAAFVQVFKWVFLHVYKSIKQRFLRSKNKVENPAARNWKISPFSDPHHHHHLESMMCCVRLEYFIKGVLGWVFKKQHSSPQLVLLAPRGDSWLISYFAPHFHHCRSLVPLHGIILGIFTVSCGALRVLRAPRPYHTTLLIKLSFN